MSKGGLSSFQYFLKNFMCMVFAEHVSVYYVYA